MGQQIALERRRLGHSVPAMVGGGDGREEAKPLSAALA